MKHADLHKHETGNIVYYTAQAFDETGLVQHAFSGRKGGVSKGTFGSLNLSILTADCPDCVGENRDRFMKALGIPQSCLVGAHQVHGDRVYRVTAADKGRGAYHPDTVIPASDALITNEPGIALIGFFADCVPVLFLDPVKRAIAIAHAGWKGTVAKIAAKTAEAMRDNFGSVPADLLAAVGPSIGPCHYQVDMPVLEKIRAAFPADWQGFLTGWSQDGRAQFNLWAANVLQLEQVGIPRENITAAGLCTYCHRNVFFSHRAGMAGRQAALIMLHKECNDDKDIGC